MSKILVANRGEIALRIIRACQEMGISTVAVHSTADADAMHVRMADESVCIGPPTAALSYLSTASIISACEISGAEAVHPGYGFLSENAEFAEILEDHGLRFIGPSAEHIRLMGDKIAARNAMSRLGVPCVPGSNGCLNNLDSARRAAREVGYPVIIKASAGGGGRGMKLARNDDELDTAFSSARSEAMAAFGNDELYLEKYLAKPRHIEIQVFGDGRGRAVHLGERDCSIQRRHQKLMEEAPAPGMDPETRARIGAICTAAIADIDYAGAGTIEFLYDQGEFSFIEMNTRLQVEHPVTECVYHVDLVKEQIRVAGGEGMTLEQDRLELIGHAVEARINAESLPDFTPCPGRVTTFHAPGGLGVRFDSALYQGCTIPPYYDSLVGKLIVHGTDRKAALARLSRALREMVVDGIQTTAPLFDQLLREDDIRTGNYDIHWLNRWLAETS
ncbi:MAG: acetyl-CoA carboxylase biotin carboxylase subunit [Paracoccaceae bacterium]|nr:acetyl-CoA carboxylase biotin carboxylase subunit [Paracoccaceae bacterium]MDE2915244.1 acetyl-CoA carboxylase biotin carboxylase subunit [Paracoccaceae bacterium]